MSTYTSRLIIDLIDRVTGPARAISGAVRSLQDAQKRNNARLTESRGRMVEAATAGYLLYRSLAAPIKAATEFETKLEDIGQKINAPISALPKLGAEIRAIGRETTQSASSIAEGMDVLAGMGANREDALGLLPAIGRAASAYNASVTDLSQAGYAALTNLKVPADQFASALDAMAAAGKAGAFELKDMAQYFPALGAGYQALGQGGVSAVADLSAALQIVRKGTGDSASAATNLNNVLQKMRAPQTVKAFQKMGVNLEKELAKAAKRGLTPIEAIAEVTNKTLKGDLSKIGYLFSDAQVQQGLRPLIQNIDEYRQIRAEAMKAQGVVEEDYQRRLQTGASAAQRFKIALENINLAVGAALLPALSSLGETIVPVINRLSAFAEAHPQLTRAIVATSAALIAFRVAAIAAQFSLLWMKGALIQTAILGMRGLGLAVTMAALPFRALIGAGRFGAAALGLLLNPLRAVAIAMRVLTIAVASTGIGAILVGIGLAGAWIYNNWNGIATAFEAFRGAFMRAVQPVMPVLTPVIEGFKWLKVTVSGIIGPIDELGGGWARLGLAAGKFVGETIVALANLPGKIIAFSGRMLNAGMAIFQSFRDGAVTKFNEILTWVQNVHMQIVQRLAAIDLKAVGIQIMNSLLEGIKSVGAAVLDYVANIGSQIGTSIKNAVSGFVGMGGGGSSVSAAAAAANDNSGAATNRMLSGMDGLAGARAAGGAVRSGSMYLVGENGPELFTAGSAGYVHNAIKTAAMLRSNAPSVPNVDWQGDGRSAASQSTPAQNINLGGIVINAAPGQSPEQIADVVELRLSKRLNALSRGAFSDGAN